MMKSSALKRLGLVSALSVFSVSAAVSAQVAEPDTAQWTHVQNGEVFTVDNGPGTGALSYRVHWDELVLNEEVNGKASTISGTSYFCDCGERADRPVMFLFNGGPGASSSPLHFALGPRLRGETGAPFESNADTILPLVDLVFIDPVETGYSRAASDDGESRFLGVAGDVEAVDAFIHAWTVEHGREASPVFITGQSYGGFRLSTLTSKLEDMDVAGLVMVSPAINMAADNGDETSVFTLPTMAATAWRFGKSDIEAATEAEAWETARAFAETGYLVALQQGDLIGAADKVAIAQKLAGMTGLSVELVEDSDLRVDIQDFLENVLADENKLVSRLNTAVTQEKRPPANPDRPDGANDPSLGLGRSNKIISEDIGAYLKAITGLEREDGYRSLNLDANFAWDWRDDVEGNPFSFSAAPRLSAYLRENEDVSLLVFGGYRDLAVPLLKTQYILTHSGLPQDRVELVAVESGHSPFDEDGTRAAFADRLEAFVKAALDRREAGQGAGQ
ncbi:S10 family serine carboxypeptidase-like protein [Henriciella litoralis]|uniref:S10 family serine carboxypeptidase-like protein n=1 Tax=Henriciella litoralis TaxID=568102 RepID=UPI00146EA83E|nr:hypothetical protein [Henriciella litoralis]